MTLEDLQKNCLQSIRQKIEEGFAAAECGELVDGEAFFSQLKSEELSGQSRTEL